VNVVALLAHPDDELFCAGTLARYASEGADVTVVTVFTDEDREPELLASVNALGVRADWYALDEYAFGWAKSWVERIEPLVTLRRPDLLISHRVEDPNHSHAYLGRIARTLTRRNAWTLFELDQTLTGGLEPDSPAPNLLVDITATVERKRAAIRCYPSQCKRYPGLERALLARDEANGWQLRMTKAPSYAEAFRIHKAVVR
jgi:LmbE family N-acetylglucosaminyl deacetylase